MSSSKDFLPDSTSVAYPASTSDSVPPASFVQIQNELTPARSPGSCKVRFSEKNEKRDGKGKGERGRVKLVSGEHLRGREECAPRDRIFFSGFIGKFVLNSLKLTTLADEKVLNMFL